jgi:hypothetical protein
VNLVWAGLIVLGVAAVAIAAMLLVRRSAPEGSYFEDGDRASGIFGVLATAFAAPSTLLLLCFLDRPYHSGGGLCPVAMQRTLQLLQQEQAQACEAILISLRLAWAGSTLLLNLGGFLRAP